MTNYGQEGFELETWKRMFGSKTSETAPCGHEVHKDRYASSSSPYGWSVDHIWPKKPEQGTRGSDIQENLQVLCYECNITKGNKLSGKFDNGISFSVKNVGQSNLGYIIGKMSTW